MANHLTFEERRLLYLLKRKKKSNTEIAELMGRHRSTICRELSRNTGQRATAPSRPNAWRTNGGWPVADRIKWMTPRASIRAAQAGAVLVAGPDCWPRERDFRRRPERWLSIKRFMIGFTSSSRSGSGCCVVAVGPPEKRGKLTDFVRIDGRPEVINGRCRYGDWEGDTIVGHGRHRPGDFGRT